MGKKRPFQRPSDGDGHFETYELAGGYAAETYEGAYGEDDSVPLAGEGDEDLLGLMPLDDGDGALVAATERPKAPTVIAGTGTSMGTPFIRRRQRPLTMRIAIFTLIASILVTGLFALTPLGGNADAGISSFQAFSGVAIWRKQTDYQWYQVRWGDTEDSIAARFKVQIGGIYALNHLAAGEELSVGQELKIPTDPTYGANYRPPQRDQASANGARFANNWWNSTAGNPPQESLCGPDGKGTATAYQLQPPNWGAYWVRGFTVIGSWISHTGVDLSGPYGNTIHAAQAGQVIWAGYDATNGLGYSVKIDHCHHISTVYGHMATTLVRVGQFVKAGDPVGLEGSTGVSTGPHVHFMVEWDNQYVDPLPYYGYSRYVITKNPIYK
ncbi:MAG: peptidoglycan DD-metalloendopeptidase family protein [Ktedonobacterales bacterium]|nr:peptidoglycan DD-metalloendopeptidase family protein [Ktedonobacterales bacterium]